jgi:hypothetical protein
MKLAGSLRGVLALFSSIEKIDKSLDLRIDCLDA